MSVPSVKGFDLLHNRNCAVYFQRGLLDDEEAVMECASTLSQWFEENTPNGESGLCFVSEHFLVLPQ